MADPARLRDLVEMLCDDACAGREAGSPGARVAADRIEAAFRDLGLAVSRQHVPVVGGDNLIAGAEQGAAVLIGAHYDHLGVDARGRVYRGADDNAAAVAATIETARALGADARRVCFVAFDAEEPPHFLQGTMGSMTFVARAAIPLEEVRLAVILDLVGHAVGPTSAPEAVRRSLFALGAEKSEGTAALVDAAASSLGDGGPAVRRLSIDLIPPLSDYEPFRRAGVPFLFLTCGRWRHYHQTTDTPDRLDYDKLASIVDLLAALARGALDRPRPRFLPDGRDDRGTVRTTRELAALMGAARAVSALDRIDRGLARGARMDVPEWATLLEIVALVEQGLA